MVRDFLGHAFVHTCVTLRQHAGLQATTSSPVQRPQLQRGDQYLTSCICARARSNGGNTRTWRTMPQLLIAPVQDGPSWLPVTLRSSAPSNCMKLALGPSMSLISCNILQNFTGDLTAGQPFPTTYFLLRQSVCAHSRASYRGVLMRVCLTPPAVLPRPRALVCNVGIWRETLQCPPCTRGRGYLPALP